ncbi:MAG TPA: mechanosensitive ion channel domain-containing protein [Steroidobacteraceae bacterium]
MVIVLLLLWLAGMGVPALAAESDANPTSEQRESRAVMTGDQVVQILDQTVDWYRTLGLQQQAATQPSDLLILYANRQTAEKLMALAFEIARANAELLSSEAGAARERAQTASQESLRRAQKELDEQRAQLEAQITAAKRRAAAASAREKSDVQARVSVLQGELDLINARRNFLANMARFQHENDEEGFGANALKAHIDAIAASIPSTDVSPPTSATAATPAASSTAATGSLAGFGIWDLTGAVLRLQAKARTIETVDRRTVELKELFTQIRTPPLEQLRRLTQRGQALAAQAQSHAADGTTLRAMRDQYDILAWLYQQTSAIVTPLSRAEILLDQYRRNLSNWRETTQRQYREALRALVVRTAMFVLMLGLVFVGAEIWRRGVFRFVRDQKQRARHLLLRKIVLWGLVIAIVASTFVTELGSLATFAGLITAGLAVAMQSILVSVVGYFFLIGKYGIRVGDRVQIGNVTGEVIDMGLVRLHLMELSGQGPMSPTGRVVGFANSIIFQASGGLFKQIPGVDLAWHEITLSLPSGADHTRLKDELVTAAREVIADYREDIVRQAREIQKAASSSAAPVDPQPQVRLRFSAEGVEAIVRYPVHLKYAAEIDERISRELLRAIRAPDQR